MKWRTKISVQRDGEISLRGMALSSLIEKHSFIEAVFLLLSGRLPSKKEAGMLDTVLTASVEHGVEVPSAFAPRISISVGNSMNAALAAGLLAIGDFHGGAVEEAAKILQSELLPKTIVVEALKNKKKLPGLGHKIFKIKDPRSEVIFKKSQKLGFYKERTKKLFSIQKELEKQTGKKLPINIDGAVAAVISDLGFDWRLGKAIFALGRLPGMIAHAYEELTDEVPYRRFEAGDVEYLGPNSLKK